jgi:hypothetical protein
MDRKRYSKRSEPLFPISFRLFWSDLPEWAGDFGSYLWREGPRRGPCCEGPVPGELVSPDPSVVVVEMPNLKLHSIN